jgi:hypothetical protein
MERNAVRPLFRAPWVAHRSFQSESPNRLRQPFLRTLRFKLGQHPATAWLACEFVERIMGATRRYSLTQGHAYEYFLGIGSALRSI